MSNALSIRPLEPADWPAVWQLLEPVFRAGETFPHDPAISEAEARILWVEQSQAVLLAVDEAGAVVGSYYLRPNSLCLGAHVANAGYVVAESHRRQGIGSQLCQHSLQAARSLGYLAMQFNLVVSTNIPGIQCWQKNGFRIVGTLPGAFRHRQLGYVDAHVMVQALENGPEEVTAMNGKESVHSPRSIAALLHDAIEDAEVSSGQIAERFGERVARIVADCTDTNGPVAAGEQKEPWLVRKRRYLEHLQLVELDSLRVSAADKAHNARDQMLDARRDPESWCRFKAGIDGTAWYQLRIHQILKRRLPASRSTELLGEALQELLDSPAYRQVVPEGDTPVEWAAGYADRQA